MNQRCRTCEHWRQESGWKEGFGVCDIIDENKREDMIIIGADDDYNLSAITALNFGCVCWEKRE